MLYKNIKHASSADIEVLNDIKDIKFQNNEKYFIIAKKDLLYVIQSKDGFGLIVDEYIIDILKKNELIGGVK
jgi:hypothetical protein